MPFGHAREVRLVSAYAFESLPRPTNDLANMRAQGVRSLWVLVVRKRLGVGEDWQGLAHSRRDELALAYFAISGLRLILWLPWPL